MYDSAYLIQTCDARDEDVRDEIIPSHTYELSVVSHMERLQPTATGFGERPGFRAVQKNRHDTRLIYPHLGSYLHSLAESDVP